jgi:hypothetical protein
MIIGLRNAIDIIVNDYRLHNAIDIIINDYRLRNVIQSVMQAPTIPMKDKISNNSANSSSGTRGNLVVKK